MATHHHAFDATAIMKFSLEHQNPLVTGLISGSENGYPATHFSLLKVSDPGVLLWSLKPSEDGIGEGLIARFWNMNGKKSAAALSLSVPLESAWKATHIETNLERLKPVSSVLNMNFAPNQIGSYRLKLKK